jgi:predicted RNase H-like HicB family nuclease
MNTIKLDLLLPHWKIDEIGKREYHDEPWLIVNIDGIDIFKMEEFNNRYEGVDVRIFFYNEDKYNIFKSDESELFNGRNLVGVCSDCRFDGCDDLFIDIKTDKENTTWELIPDRIKDIKIKYCFNAIEYREQIEILKEKYFSYTWESFPHKVRRICNNFIHDYTTKDGKPFDGIMIEDGENGNSLNKIITIYYYDDFEHDGNYVIRPYRSFDIEWDGKTLENAMENLQKYADKHLIKQDSISEIIIAQRDRLEQFLYDNIDGLAECLNSKK